MDQALKQRLVGASVIIALAVVVLPMLLSGPGDGQSNTQTIEVPAKPSELSFESRRFPLGTSPQTPLSVPAAEPETQAPEAGGSDSEAAEQAVGPQKQPAIEPVDVAATGNDAAAVQPAPVVAVPEETENLPGRYLVQVASFSTVRNAQRLVERLVADGLPVLQDTIEADVGPLHRVRVGPYDALDAANQAMTKIRTRTPDVNPRVIDLRPDETAPVTDPSDPLVRWVVQLGSFGEAANARQLVDRLQTAGFKAFAVAITDAQGVHHKVHVGPEIERQSAVRVAADIQKSLGLKGLVISVD